MKVVLDTNVYISAFLIDELPRQIIKEAAERKYTLYISPHIISETKGVLDKKFNQILTIHSQALLSKIIETTNLAFTSQAVKKIPNNHPDNQVLACCFEVKADYLVTGDKKHLLPLKKYKTTRIISPAEFIKISSTQTLSSGKSST